VRMKGLEPPRLAAPDPKSGASTNSATSAGSFLRRQKYFIFSLRRKVRITF
jgi:hypothetical protein